MNLIKQNSNLIRKPIIALPDLKDGLKNIRNRYFIVTGHTDLVGTSDYNYGLALKRAQIVGKYLEDSGVDAGRMIIGSEGETNQFQTT